MEVTCGQTVAFSGTSGTSLLSPLDELRAKFWTEIAAGNAQEFVQAKLAERDARHLRQGESRYLVEPNIKEGKGGLRDLHTLFWIAKYIQLHGMKWTKERNGI